MVKGRVVCCGKGRSTQAKCFKPGGVENAPAVGSSDESGNVGGRSAPLSILPPTLSMALVELVELVLP